MSDSVRPHRRQPTRLPCPWDSPGKNTGVGCHFLLQCVKVKSQSEVAQLCLTLSDPMDCSLLGSSIHGVFQARVLEWGAIAFSEYDPSLPISHQDLAAPSLLPVTPYTRESTFNSFNTRTKRPEFGWVISGEYPWITWLEAPEKGIIWATQI